MLVGGKDSAINHVTVVVLLQGTIPSPPHQRLLVVTAGTIARLPTASCRRSSYHKPSIRYQFVGPRQTTLKRNQPQIEVTVTRIFPISSHQRSPCTRIPNEVEEWPSQQKSTSPRFSRTNAVSYSFCSSSAPLSPSPSVSCSAFTAVVRGQNMCTEWTSRKQVQVRSRIEPHSQVALHHILPILRQKHSNYRLHHHCLDW